jgi:hypothetical protein
LALGTVSDLKVLPSTLKEQRFEARGSEYFHFGVKSLVSFCVMVHLKSGLDAPTKIVSAEEQM